MQGQDAVMDDADRTSAREELAMAQFEEQQRQRRMAESLRPFDPSLPIHCVDCGETVSPQRLAAYPRTRRCVACAAEVERYFKERA